MTRDVDRVPIQLEELVLRTFLVYVELFCRPKNRIASELHHDLLAKQEHSKLTAFCRGNMLLLCPGPFLPLGFANGRQISAQVTGIEPDQTQRQSKTSRQACTAFAASIY